MFGNMYYIVTHYCTTCNIWKEMSTKLTELTAFFKSYKMSQKNEEAINSISSVRLPFSNT